MFSEPLYKIPVSIEPNPNAFKLLFLGKTHKTPIQLAVFGLWDLSCHQTLALTGKCLGFCCCWNTTFVPNFVLHRKINLCRIYYKLVGTFLFHKTLFCQAGNLYLKNPGSETIFKIWHFEPQKWISSDIKEFLEPSILVLFSKESA